MPEPQLFSYQSTAELEGSKLFQTGIKRLLYVLPGGSGKCLGKDTPILMYDGTIKKVQDIIVGDKLMGNNSLPRNVLSITSGIDMLYKITPVKGDPYIVNESHILSLKFGSGEDSVVVMGKRYFPNDIINISILDYFKQNKWFKSACKGWRTNIDFTYKGENIGIDPYFLGLWLGDGDSRKVMITTGDYEIKRYLKEYAKNNNFELRIEPNSENSENYFFNDIERRHGVNGICKNTFRKANLLLNKHIPHDYKTSSRRSRLELLAGLMDSDGHLSKCNVFDYTSKLEHLIDDICFIARSLGFSAYKSKSIKKCYNNGKIGTYWRCCISGDTDLIPCKIKRKQANKRLHNKNVLYTSIKVEKLDFGDYYGFEIDGNRLFCLGDFTVTHNTILSGSIAKHWHEKIHQFPKVAFFTHREELFNQCREKWLLFGNITEPINSDTSSINPNSKSFVVMVETFSRRSDNEEFLKFFKGVGLVFIDEAHRADFNKILHHFSHSLIIGLTATPISSDKKHPMNKTWDAMYEAATTTQLQQLNSLNPKVGVVPCDCYQIKGIDRDKIKKKGGEYEDKSAGEQFRSTKQIQNTLDNYFKLGNGMKAFVFNIDIEHNEDMYNEFKAAGVENRQLHSSSKKWFGAPSSSLSKWWRRDTFLWLKNTPGAMVNNIGIATTGTDEPSIELIMTNYASLSISKVVQSHTRGARPYQYPNGEWKQFYRWLDFGMNCSFFSTDGNNNLPWQSYFDMPFSSHNREGVGGYKSCPICGSLCAVSARYCQGIKEDWLSQEQIECGYEFPLKEKEVDTVSREMVKYITDGIVVSDLVKMAERNGNQIGSVFYRIMDLICTYGLKMFGTFILSEQFEVLLDISFKKIKELSKYSKKRVWRDAVRKQLISKMRSKGFVLDIEELGDAGLLEELKNDELKMELI